MNTTTTKTRFQTGETSPISGRFQFDGFVNTNDAKNYNPTQNERTININTKQTFPSIGNHNCWWKCVKQS